MSGAEGKGWPKNRGRKGRAVFLEVGARRGGGQVRVEGDVVEASHILSCCLKSLPSGKPKSV